MFDGQQRGIEGRHVNRLKLTELAAIPDESLVDAVLQVVWASEAESDQLREGLDIIHAAWLLDAEIQNGGFHQYFWNHKQEHVPMTRKALARLGAREHLAVFEEALAALERQPIEPTVGAPETALGAFSESAMSSPMDSLDDRWYDLPGIDQILVQYIRANPESVSDHG